MADPYQAGQTLGEAIFGDQSETYDKALRGAYSTDSALQQARRNRALRLIDEARQEQRGGITPALVQAALGGDLGAQAELGARTLGSNQTINLGQLDVYKQPRFGEAQNIRFEGLLGDEPDIGRANRATAYVEDKPYAPVKVLGGAYVPEAATLGEEFTFVPTPESLARIEATERRADAAVQRANRPPAIKATGGSVKKGAITKAEYDRLPSGTTFLAPDGTVRKKP